MGKEYRFKLQPYRGKATRYKCPQCGANRSKTFARYVDTYSGDQVAESVGKCDREDNCGYHYTPKQYFDDNGLTPQDIKPPVEEVKEFEMPVSFLVNQLLWQSTQMWQQNGLCKYLITHFGYEIANTAASRYFLGSSRKREDATIFWQVDTSGNIRTGKIIAYNPIDGRRYKDKHGYYNFVHALKDSNGVPAYPEYNLKQCFFGEHLLREDRNKEIAIVESEKTAIIASIYMPQFTWIASGGKHGLNEEKWLALKGRRVILYPDINAHDCWVRKAQSINNIANVAVSNLLEKKANERDREEGLDLADYLLRMDLRDFVDPKAAHENQEQYVQSEGINMSLFQKVVKSVGFSKQVDRKEPLAFVGKCGQLYIRQPDCPSKYAIYDNVEAYNQRQQIPEYRSELFVMQDFKAWVEIDLSGLTVE